MAGRFIKSATSLRDCPESIGQYEIVLVGRSNAGKSAIINGLAGMKSLARVSQKPGKTEWLNYYQLEGELVLVDTPGYGYAARGEKARQLWAPMIEEYLQKRDALRGVILVVDGARQWSPQEEDLVQWLSNYDRKCVLAVTKVDRFNQKEKSAAERHFRGIKGLQDCVFTSAQKGIGIEQLLRSVFENLIRT